MSEEKVLTKEVRDKTLNKLAAACGSIFYYQALRGEKKHGLCSECFDPADYTQRMKRDKFYHRLLCAKCVDRAVEKLYLNRQKKVRDPNDGHYTITAFQARMMSKGLHPLAQKQEANGEKI